MGFHNFRLNIGSCFCTIAMSLFPVLTVEAAPCNPPTVPFVPSDNSPRREFAELIKRDFEAYFEDVQDYFRCLNEEYARAFEEAQNASRHYAQFLQKVIGERPER